MILHQNREQFIQAVTTTAEQINIPTMYVEKDYWVTYALHTIFQNEIGESLVFKGGTALAKCYDLIERFSEDIDLVVLRKETDTNNSLTTKIKKVSKILSAKLPEVNIEGITHKMGMNRKTTHSYAKEFSGTYGQVRDIIVIEATWLGYFESYTTRAVNSFIGETLLKNNQSEIANQYGLMPFDVKVLEPIRTLCEKIMSLVRFSYTENPIEDLKKKIRHVYDLHQLFQKEDFLIFLKSDEFEKMLLKVANDDVVSFKNNNQWLQYHPKNAFIFDETESVWKELKGVYNGDFKNLVYGEFPKDDKIFETLITIKDRLQSINWSVKL